MQFTIQLFLVQCTNSSVCDGKPSVSGDKGWCDFSQTSNGVCKYCSDVSDGCADESDNGKRECKEICEGKCKIIYDSHTKYLIVNHRN